MKDEKTCSEGCLSLDSHLPIHDNIVLVFLPVYFLLQERVLKCARLIHDLVLTSVSTKGAPMASVPQSPSGVLDASCLSYKSDETTFGYSAGCSHENTPQTKRLKIDR